MVSGVITGMVMAESDNGDDRKGLVGTKSPWRTPFADTGSADDPAMGVESWPALGDAPPRPKSTDSAVKPPSSPQESIALSKPQASGNTNAIKHLGHQKLNSKRNINVPPSLPTLPYQSGPFIHPMAGRPHMAVP
ncbi:hypothetical protein SAY86_026468 [Trapa natans]|uniref:Uncharacterized protein n=1 Tax=Trapa natans TaxID=22666 RepID=A0AAN7QF26_TRANT|nr:hypothetical protein SAY86_026468 [Trapa natans]